MRPVPGDDVIIAGCDEEVSGCGVGAVDDDVVLGPSGVTGSGYIDKPE